MQNYLKKDLKLISNFLICSSSLPSSAVNLPLIQLRASANFSTVLKHCAIFFYNLYDLTTISFQLFHRQRTPYFHRLDNLSTISLHHPNSQTHQAHHHQAAHTGGGRRNDLINLYGGRRSAALLDQLVQSQSAGSTDAGGEHRTHGGRHLSNLIDAGLHRHPFRSSVRVLLQGHKRCAEEQERGASTAGHSAASAV